jgi:hypothetical protein
MGHIGNDGFDLYFGVDSAQLVGGGDSFGQTVGDVLLVVQNLPLQIVEFEKISIHDPHETYAGAD